MADRRSQKALSDFLSEAQETTDALAKELLQLEKAFPSEPDPTTINSIFRGAHSLKGLSAMFGVERLGKLAHALEDLLDEVRMGRRPLDPPTLDLLLEAPELMGRIIAEEASGEPETTAETAESLARRLREPRLPPPETADVLAGLDLGEEVRGVLTEYEEHRLRANLAKGVTLYRARVSFPLESFDQGLAALNEALRSIGEVISTLPSADRGDPGCISFELLFGSKEPLDRVRRCVGPNGEVTEVPRRMEVAVEVSAPAPAQAQAAQPSEPESSIRSASQAVRVDIHKLDRLMNTIGELVLVKTNLLRIGARLRAGESLGALGLELHRESRLLERKLNELQAGVLEVRMVPLGQIFDKLARMVRKVSRGVGKEVELQTSGADVELDKLIVEELSDPLMHLIRNAIDHAIEPPQAREQLGKPRAGTVRLEARQKGNHVELVLEDDGSGMDEARILEVAVQRGLVTEASAREMSRRELVNLIFVPGFSTARQVTALSGRGVGLDVVKNNIAKLSGIVELYSERGRGTRFEITLPVTLAIIRALIVDVVGRTYAVPLNSVLEIIEVRVSDLRTIETREVISLRGTTLPLVRLGRFFGLGTDEQQKPPVRPAASLFVVVVGLAHERLGIAVEALVGQQDIVVKPLGPQLEGVRGIAGATDLGNRRTVLVLDVGAIIEDVLSGEPLREAAG